VILHTINKSPHDHQVLHSCLRMALPGSGILLIENGVYAALQGQATEHDLRNYLKHSKVHVLTPDLEARGLGNRDLVGGIGRVDYSGFVDLCVASSKVVAWY
jgi:tRNA 2-thiouridine synthesizing protein B